jgi:hypothetical protein
MRDLDAFTRYDLGKLRGEHDRWISRTHRARLTAGEAFEDIARDAEMTYHLDALDAIIDVTALEDTA